MKVGKNNIKIMKKIRCYVLCRKPLLLFDAANIGFISIHSEKKRNFFAVHEIFIASNHCLAAITNCPL